MKPIFLLVLAALAVFLFVLARPGAVEREPGVLAPVAPEQELVAGAEPFVHAGYRLTPLADFRLEARVLARHDYHFDREADLAPLDLGLGWGAMSDSAVLAAIEFSQHYRFMSWRTERFPVPRREIETSAANMHIIPADDGIAGQLDEVRVGHVVRLAGKLVAASAADGWHWRSSLSRADNGAGACELFYVEAVSFE